MSITRVMDPQIAKKIYCLKAVLCAQFIFVFSILVVEILPTMLIE